jgi:integrase
LDTGARRGETFKLKFSDLDFENRLITFQALNTKTLKKRQVGMTNRVYNELLALWEKSSKDASSSVFNVKCVKRAFDSACKEAGIEAGRPFGITINNLRHTAATRLVKGQMPISMVGRILAHQNPQTTYRYLTTNNETLYQTVSILESFQDRIVVDSQNQSELIN